MTQKILDDFRRLAALLESQKSSLARDDSARLAALAPLIENYSVRLGKHDLRRDRFPIGERQEFDVLVQKIDGLVAANHQGWLKRRDHLVTLQKELCNARRFVKQAQPAAANRPRFSLTG